MDEHKIWIPCFNKIQFTELSCYKLALRLAVNICVPFTYVHIKIEHRGFCLFLNKTLTFHTITAAATIVKITTGTHNTCYK